MKKRDYKKELLEAQIAERKLDVKVTQVMIETLKEIVEAREFDQGTAYAMHTMWMFLDRWANYVDPFDDEHYKYNL